MDIKNLELLDLEELLEEDKEKKEFTVDTPAKANWCIEKILEEQHRLNLYEEAMNEKIESLKAGFEDEKRKMEDRTTFLNYHLSKYINLKETKAKKSKTTGALSLVLPSGRIKYTPPKNVFTPIDNAKNLKNSETLINYCKEKAKDFYLVETNESVNWTELKKDLDIIKTDVVDKETGEVFEKTVIIRKSNGEILDCLSYKENDPKLSVEKPKEKE